MSENWNSPSYVAPSNTPRGWCPFILMATSHCRELHAVDKWRRVVDKRNHDPNNHDRNGNSSCELRQPGLNKSRDAGSEAGSDRGLPCHDGSQRLL